LGCAAPSNVIPIAEECGQILPIGDWVLRSACERSRQWLDAGLPPVVVSVNISARQFHQQDLAAWVLGTLEHAQLPPERLELELTESLIAQVRVDTLKIDQSFVRDIPPTGGWQRSSARARRDDMRTLSQFSLCRSSVHCAAVPCHRPRPAACCNGIMSARTAE
jgi:EAL domain-containing protein (putative c-di-GMP-specific phosphodiesterase class I)